MTDKFPKKLVINADDFGMFPEVNRGIIECFESGSITSTTLMVNAEGTSDAVSLAEKYPDLGVGLHFTLTHGKPVSPPWEIPSLVDEGGNFCSRFHFERGIILRRIKLLDVKKELEAQIGKFRNFGLKMTHIDGHHHVHIFPSIFKVVADYAIREGLPVRIPWVSYKFIKPSITLKSIRTILRKSLLHMLIGRIPAVLYDDMLVPNRFLSMHDFVPLPDEFQHAHYRKLIEAAGAGLTEIMVHPAYNSERLRNLYDDANVRIREMELKALTGFSLVESAKGLNMETRSYRVCRSQK